MTKKPETLLAEKVMAWIKRQAGDSFHVHGSMFQRAGEPDLCGEIPVPFGWMHLKWELKVPGGEPSKLQLITLDKYSKRGYSVGIVTNTSECKALLEEFIQCGNNKQSWAKEREKWSSIW